MRRRSIRASAHSSRPTSRSAAAPTRRSSRSARRGSTAFASSDALNARQIPGVRFYPVRFTPSSSKFAGQECQGVFIVVTDRNAVRPVRVGVEIASALVKLVSRPARRGRREAARSDLRPVSRESRPATIRRRSPRPGRRPRRGGDCCVRNTCSISRVSCRKRYARRARSGRRTRINFGKIASWEVYAQPQENPCPPSPPCLRA